MIFCISFGLQAAAQQKPAYTVQFSDSLPMQPGQRFITNAFIITNHQQNAINLRFQLEVPSGWYLVGRLKPLQLQPGEAYVVPVNVSPAAGTSAAWMPFRLQIEQQGQQSKTTHVFRCKAVPVLRFTTTLQQSKALLYSEQRRVDIKVMVRNTGNIDQKLSLRFQNYFFNLLHEQQILLPPNTDTIVSFPLNVREEHWKDLKKQVISIKVSDTTNTVKLLLFELAKAASVFKQNASAYTTVPLELETGTMLNDNALTYFGVVKGKLGFNEKSTLDFSYKTKEMGAFNQIQNDVLNLRFSSPKLSVFAGQITDAHAFVGFGNGIKANYLVNANTELYFSGTFHNKNFYYKNDQFEAGIRHKLGKFRLDDMIAANFDAATHQNSYLTLHRAALVASEKLQLSVVGGLGVDVEPAGRQTKPGAALGYKAIYTVGSLKLSSEYQANSRFFPGVDKGMLNQNHNIRWQTKAVTLSAFFQSNRRLFLLFRDTVYNSDFLSYNTQKTGIFSSFRLQKMNIGVGLGSFGQFGSTSGNNMDRYKYVEGFYFWQPSNKIKATLSSFNGFDKLSRGSETVWINSGFAGVYVGRLGITAMFTRNPQIFSDSVGKRLHHYDVTKNITPNFGFSLFQRFHFNLSYTLSQTSFDDRVTSYASGSISYMGKRNGLSASLYGIMPITKSNANSPGLRKPYFTLSIRKKLLLPLLFKRKHYNLNLVAFLDDNLNGIKDAGETALANLPIQVGDASLITNKAGMAVIKNADTGKYVIELDRNTITKGYLPAAGNRQVVVVKQNTKLAIPFKKSCTITGNVSVVKDPLSNLEFSPDGIKIIAIDSLNHQFSTLTDSKGSFVLHVPEGSYVVTLNPEAFDEKLRPEKMAFVVDLTQRKTEEVFFTIKQEKRKVRILKD